MLAGVLASDHRFAEAVKSAETACELAPDNKACKDTLQKIKTAEAKSK